MTDSKHEQIKRVHDIFMLLMHVSKRWFVQQLQTFGLTLPQFVTLAALAAHKQPCTMSEVTAVTFQDPPTTTGVIDRLVRMKLVQRTRSESDRRVVLVHATQPGLDLVEKIEAFLMNESLQNYEGMTDEQLNNLEQLLRHLLRIHLGRYMLPQGADLDAEIERLEYFVRDPICYVKLEGNRVI